MLITQLLDIHNELCLNYQLHFFLQFTSQNMIYRYSKQFYHVVIFIQTYPRIELHHLLLLLPCQECLCKLHKNFTRFINIFCHNIHIPYTYHDKHISHSFIQNILLNGYNPTCYFLSFLLQFFLFIYSANINEYL